MKRLFAALALPVALAISFHAAAAAPAPKAERTITLRVTKNGFEPDTVRLRAGQPVNLVVTREVERTCATDIVVSEYGIKKALPLGRAVSVRFTPRKAGSLRYACAMDMIAGALIVE